MVTLVAMFVARGGQCGREERGWLVAAGLGVLALGAAPEALAQSKVFNGSANGNWSNPSNWTPAGVPGAGDSVEVPSGTQALRVDANVAVASLSLWRGATITGPYTVTTAQGATIWAGTLEHANGSTLSGVWTVAAGANLRPDFSCGNRLLNATINGSVAWDAGTPRVRWNSTTIHGSLRIADGRNAGIAFEGDQVFAVTGGVTVAGWGELRLGSRGGGTLIVPEGTAISGGSIWFDQAPCGGGEMGLVNNGVIRSTVTNRQVSINVAVAGSGRLECAGGSMELRGPVRENHLVVSAGTLKFGGLADPTEPSLKWSRGGGDVWLTAAIDLAGRAFVLGPTTGGPWRLVGGGIENGTLEAAVGQLIITSVCGNRLSNLTVRGGLVMGAPHSTTRWNNTSVLGRVVVPAGASAVIGFEGDQTFRVTEGVSIDPIGRLSLAMQAPGTLTVDGATAISGGQVVFSAVNACGFAAKMAVVNNGVVSCSTPAGGIFMAVPGGIENAGVLAATGGQIMVDTGMPGRCTLINTGTIALGPLGLSANRLALSNHGTISVANTGSSGPGQNTISSLSVAALVNSAGGVITVSNEGDRVFSMASGSVLNEGTIRVAGGQFSLPAGVFSGSGRIEVVNTATALTGPFDPRKVRLARSGGVVRVTGDGDLGEGELTLGPEAGAPWLLTHGTLRNGAIHAPPGALVAAGGCGSGRVSDLTINGALTLAGGVRWNNTVVNGTITATNTCASIAFEGDQTFEVTRGLKADSMCSLTLGMLTPGTLKIAGGTTISGGNITFGFDMFDRYGLDCLRPAMTLVNHGTLLASGRYRSIKFSPNVTWADFDAASKTLLRGTIGLTDAQARLDFWNSSLGPEIDIRRIAPGAGVRLSGPCASFQPWISRLSRVEGTLTLSDGWYLCNTPDGGALHVPGSLVIGPGSGLCTSGHLLLSSTSSVTIGVAGNTPSGFGRLLASGLVNLGGALNVVPVGGYVLGGCSNRLAVIGTAPGSKVFGAFATTSLPPTAGVGAPGGAGVTAGVSVLPEGVVVVTSNAADIAWSDGTPGRDGLVNNGDFQLFFTQFFTAQCPGCGTGGGTGAGRCVEADIGGDDGAVGADGCVNNGDFHLFFGLFFAGCN